MLLRTPLRRPVAQRFGVLLALMLVLGLSGPAFFTDRRAGTSRDGSASGQRLVAPTRASAWAALANLLAGGPGVAAFELRATSAGPGTQRADGAVPGHAGAVLAAPTAVLVHGSSTGLVPAFVDSERGRGPPAGRSAGTVSLSS
jgi:hypothetical protein